MGIKTARLVRVDASFEGETGPGVAARFGDPADDGLSPMDTVLLALGACTATDVHSIAGKKRQGIDRYEILVRGEQRDEHPRVFTRIDITHVVEGPDLDAEAIRRSIELSAGKYCPVNAMLSAGPTEVHHGYVVRRTGDSPVETVGEALVTGPFRVPDAPTS